MSRRFPQALEAEVAVLGNLLIDDSRIEDIAAILSPADFFSERHQKLFELMLDMRRAGSPVDSLLVVDALIAMDNRAGGTIGAAAGPSASYGGLFYVTALPDRCAVTENIEWYARRITETAQRRAALAQLADYEAALYDEQTPLSDTLSVFEAGLKSIADTTTGGAEWSDSTSLAEASYEGIVARNDARKKGRLPYLSTGLADLDALQGGLRPGELIIVAGRPGMGKTSLALGMALSAAQAGARVGFISREMTGTQLTDRFLAMLSQINGERIRDGQIEDSEWSPLEDACQAFSLLPIYVAERARSIGEIRAASRRLHARHGLDLLIVDYLQRVSAPGDSQPERLGNVAVGCKSIARDDLQVPVVLLSQFNRDADGSANPRAADAKGSGDIEQEADVMLFPIRRSEINPEAEDDEAHIVVGKNRPGRCGRVEVRWDGPTTRYLDPKPSHSLRVV